MVTAMRMGYHQGAVVVDKDNESQRPGNQQRRSFHLYGPFVPRRHAMADTTKHRLQDVLAASLPSSHPYRYTVYYLQSAPSKHAPLYPFQYSPKSPSKS